MPLPNKSRRNVAKAISPSVPPILEKGTRVRVKTTMLGKRLGITPIPRRGGEGVIDGVEIGRRGKVIYHVLVFRSGHRRPVYPKDLVVRRQPKQKRKHNDRQQAK